MKTHQPEFGDLCLAKCYAYSKPNLKLILVMEYCNQTTGYPEWRFDYRA